MKYSEAKQALRKLGLEVIANHDAFMIETKQVEWIGTVDKDNQYGLSINRENLAELATDDQQKVFEIMTQLAQTPLQDREENGFYKVAFTDKFYFKKPLRTDDGLMLRLIKYNPGARNDDIIFTGEEYDDLAKTLNAESIPFIPVKVFTCGQDDRDD